jgi:DNA adenine methylase
LNDTQHIVNVASVPQRSPFRYPGGKTWLVPRIRQWLAGRARERSELIEPFAGGGIVSLTAAAEGLVGHVTMAELDAAVAAVWRTIIDDEGGGEWLAEEIVSFTLTPESVEVVLTRQPRSLREQAFGTILRNRVNRGGIMAPGAGLIRHGEGGRGLHSRWYPVTLKKRILDIVRHRERITFIAGDGFDLLKRFADRPDALIFIDPPYTVAGKRAGSRLYSHPSIDHEELFRVCSTLRGDFLMTYDDAAEVRSLAERFGFAMQAVAMKNTHHAKMHELLIGRNLEWVVESAR